MRILKNQLQLQEQYLSRIMKQAQRDIDNAPPGTLRITCKGDNIQYYLRDNPTDTLGKYIKKSEHTLIQSLAQKCYAKKVLKIKEKKMKSLQKFYTEFFEDDIDEVYREQSEQRRKLIIPYVLPEEEYILQWMKEKGEEKKINEKRYDEQWHFRKQNHSETTDENEVLTNKGEAVCSKSEKILADKFGAMQIPYIYELPIYLQGYGYVKPDFLVLNKNERKEFYWEHLGLIDQEKYCHKTIKKLNTYA